jgi:hypothetical protein
MTLFVLAYAAGLLTVASPCMFPILPFVLARAETPFGRGGLPMLIGLALAGLAAVAGGTMQLRLWQSVRPFGLADFLRHRVRGVVQRHRPSKRRCLRSAGHRRGCSAMTTEK